MSNDVVIHVRVKQDARDGFAAVGKEAEAQGEASAHKFSGRFGTVIGRMGQLLSEPIRKAGTHIGEQLGQHGGTNFVTRVTTVLEASKNKFTQIGKTVGEHFSKEISTSVTESVVQGVRDANGRLRDERGRLIGGARSGGAGGAGGRGGRGGAGGNAGSVDVDVDKQSLLSRFAGWGKDAASSFYSGFSSILGGIFSGDIWSKLLFAGGVAGLGWIIAAPLAAAISSGILLALGGGAIAVGVASALRDPRIKGAVDELKERLKKLFGQFGEPFRGPVANFLEKFNKFLTSMMPNFEHLGRVLGPVADKLGSGIIGMLQNMLPGLIDGIEGAAPIIETLAKRLPDIGQALGDFFREIGENGDEAAVFFNDLITFLLKVIDWVGKLIGFFTRLYAGIRNFVADAKRAFMEFGLFVIGIFEKLLNSALVAFGWMPGIGGKLRTARAEFTTFRKDVNAELAKIKDKEVRIRIRTLGLAAANAAVGVAERLADLGYGKAAGGIIGQAASGGIRNGLTWVGERGPELISAPPGSRVWSAGDSMRMSRGSSVHEEAGQVLEVRFAGTTDPMIRALMDGFQFRIVRKFGGSAQAALGR